MSNAMFENMTVSSLESLLKATYDKLLEVKLADPPNQTAVETLQTDVIDIANAIKTKTAEKTENKTADLGVKNEPKIQIQKELQIALRDNVPSFQSGVDVHSFINALELYYDLYVAPNKSADFEKMFVRLSTGKMSVEYGSTMTNFERQFARLAK